MTLVIGTDEAGYGPNLGPLVVAATAWRVAAAPDAVEDHLARAVANAAPGVWGDSKKIYRAGEGFPALERGAVLAMALAAGGVAPTSWLMLPTERAGEPAESDHLERLSVPRYPHAPSLREASLTVAESLASTGVSVEAVRACVVQPSAFNGLLAAGLNKSDILSQVTLDLARHLAAQAAPTEPLVIWCDRHGGRRRYAPAVARAFDRALVRPLEETAHQSVYELPPAGRIEFTVGGEARVPVAAASMTAKYLRELAMLAFNAYWGERVPGLVPTAGYPVDAARWRRDAAAAIEAAGLSMDAIWRRA